MTKLSERRPSAPLMLGVIAIVLALSGSALALPGKNTVNSGDVKNGTLKSQDVKNDRLTGADIDESTLAGIPTVMAASVPQGNSCTLDSNTGGITATTAGGFCDVTFPQSVVACSVGASPLHPSADVGGEASIRKLGGAVVRVSRFDSAGGTPTAGLFTVYAIC